MQNSLFWSSALAYTVSLVGLTLYLRKADDQKPHLRALIISCTVIATALNAVALYSSSASVLDTSQSVMDSISLAIFTTVILFTLVSLFRSTLTLGLIVLPLAILSVLVGPSLNTPTASTINDGHSLGLHLIFAAITFALLSLAAAQALILLVQEQQLKTFSSSSRPWLTSLPPLQSMDSQLFQFVLIGFVMLLVSLYLGISSNINIHGQSFNLSHHIVLTLLAAVGFALLLIGRMLFGWRGKQAAKYTLIAHSVFLIGYFGTRFVREFILS